MKDNSSTVIPSQSFHDPAAEAALLGCMICDSTLIEEIASTVETDAFALPEHQIIFDGIRDTFSRFGEFDLVLLRNQIHDKVSEIGGVDYLMKVADSTPSSANWPHYAKIVQDASNRRKLTMAVHQAIRSLSETSMSIDEVLATLQDGLQAVQIVKPGEAVLASTIKPKAIQWLWPNRFPIGMTSILAGEMKLGKSQIAMQMGAIVSCGRVWPDGAVGSEPGGVLIVSGEDDAARAIVPRLKAVDADLSRIKIMEYPCLDLFVSSAKLVAEAKRIPDCKLVIIDPVTSFMGACNQNDNSDVRKVMRDLGDVAVKTNTAIVLVTHLSKKVELGVKLRVLGSVGFTAAARSVWVVFQKGEDAETRVLWPAGANYSDHPTGMQFRDRNKIS